MTSTASLHSMMFFLLLILNATSAAAQTVLWDFEGLGTPQAPGPLPAGWTNDWNLEFGACTGPSQFCDTQNQSWGVADGELVPPRYDSDGTGMDTAAESPSFKSELAQDVGAGGIGLPILTFVISYSETALNNSGAGNDVLSILLIPSVGASAQLEPTPLPLNSSIDWVAADKADNEQEVADGRIVVQHELTAEVEYRLRIRAFDNDQTPETFSGMSIDNIAVTNGVILGVGPLQPGDFDDDSDVDGADLIEWQRGDSTTPLSEADLADWQANFGTNGSSSANAAIVPEPTLAVVLLSLLAALPSRHLRRHR